MEVLRANFVRVVPGSMQVEPEHIRNALTLLKAAYPNCFDEEWLERANKTLDRLVSNLCAAQDHIDLLQPSVDALHSLRQDLEDSQSEVQSLSLKITMLKQDIKHRDHCMSLAQATINNLIAEIEELTGEEYVSDAAIAPRPEG